MQGLGFVPRRLDKYVRDATLTSVAAVARLLASGQVEINGAQNHHASQLVFEEDAVTCSGQTLLPRTVHTHLVLNKPLGITTSLRDPDGRADLSRYTQLMPVGVFPVGRLDRMTSGLLLFTTDGDLANAVLHPDHHTDKLYWLWLNEYVADNDARLSQLQAGVALQDGIARMRRVEVFHRTEHCTELHVTLNEGKNRQIRRMMRALDFYLHALHRKQVGPLTLGTLPPGGFRELSVQEVQALWRATGGQARVRVRKIAALHRLAQACRASGQPHLRLERWLAGFAASTGVQQEETEHKDAEG